MSRRVDRVFLDANVLFSAAYLPESRLRDLWDLEETELVTSELALEEARRNLLTYNPSAIPVLEDLSSQLTVIPGVPPQTPLPHGLHLSDKDMPILSGAAAAHCTHLLTGDKRHFGALYGRRVHRLLILTPGRYLRGRRRPR